MIKRKVLSILAVAAIFWQSTIISVIAAECTETALGCVPYTVNGFASWFLKILFGIAGGIAFLLMIYGFILLGTSSGDEKKLQGAKETISSAIIGLLVSIFALFLFRLIAVNILQIPGISKSGSGSGGGGNASGVHTKTTTNSQGNTIETTHGGGGGENF